MLPASQHSGCSPPQAAQFSLDYLRTWTKASAGGCSDYKPMGVYLCLCICVCVCVCICLCAYLCICLLVCVYICAYVCVYVSLYVFMWICGGGVYICVFDRVSESTFVSACIHEHMYEHHLG